MRPAEQRRARVAFGGLAAVPVFLAGWLFWVQVAEAGELPRGTRAPLRLVPETADRQAVRHEVVPAPRGTLVDRRGNVLAIDREVYDVRARIDVPRRGRDSVRTYLSYLARTADRLADALVQEQQLADRAYTRSHRHADLMQRLRQGFRTADLTGLPLDGPLPADHPHSADVLVENGVDTLATIDALRQLDGQNGVRLDFLRAYRRHYPHRELTHGLVGHVATEQVPDGDGEGSSLLTYGKVGLEAQQLLEPGASVTRPFRRDGRRNAYFQSPVADAPVATVLHTTIDLDLQRVAMRELKAQAESKERSTKEPLWGAMVLVEMATGDVLAAASWHRGATDGGAVSFTPLQSLYEPGSIVKPLVMAYALEAGVIDWNEPMDCTFGGATYRSTIASLGRRRPVTDDHPCGELTPHGVVVNSSNIGAAYCGLRLSRDQWRGYLDYYGFGQTLGLNLPYESRGGENPLSFTNPNDRGFRANTAISFSIGYQLTTNAMQMARAYLRLFCGRGAELRLVRGADVGGEHYEAPAAERAAAPRFRPEVVESLRAAMVDVVSADPHATAVTVHDAFLKKMGIDLHGLVAGKTGTAVTDVAIPGRGKVRSKNASFVGFLPADAPRWLAVCVLQRDSGASFYGSSYAAPPAVRLLLQAQRHAERLDLHRPEAENSSGSSTSPDGSGWGRGAPGTTR